MLVSGSVVGSPQRGSRGMYRDVSGLSSGL